MKASIFNQVCSVLTLCEGDRIDQEVLFDVQDKLCNLLIKESNQAQHKKLVKDYPWFFRLKVVK